MSAWNKQLKIWRDDFLKYYNRTSLVTRIVIGAALAFAIVHTARNYMIRPMKARITEVSKQLDAMSVIPDIDLMMQDIKNRERRASAQLASLQQKNREAGEKSGGLTRGEIGRILLELRRLMDENRIRILSESRVVAQPVRRVSSRAGQNAPPDTRIKLTLPETMTSESYHFRILGGFQDIRRFLHDAYSADALFYLNNISIRQSEEQMTDREFRQYTALECSFELHIPYLKGN